MDKKTISIIILLFAVSACSIEEPVPVKPSVLTVSAGQVDLGNTKVQLNSSLETVWTTGDKLSVFCLSDANEPWSFDGETGDKSGTLSRDEEIAGSNAYDNTLLVYPYNEAAARTSASVVTTTLPSAQAFAAGSYAPGSNLMVASGTEETFVMKNVCSFLDIKLKGTKKVSSITFQGNSGELVSGPVSVDVSTLAVTMTGSDDADKQIVLNCAEGVQLDSTKDKDFIIVVPPTTFTGGFNAVIAYSDGTSETKSTSASLTLVRNTIQTIDDAPEIDYDIEDYSGEWASDGWLDAVGTDADIYHELNDWNNVVTVTYSGSEAVTTSTNPDILIYKTGEHVTVDFGTNEVKNVEIVVRGKSSDGSLKVYGGNKYKLTLDGVDLTSTKGPAINSQCKKRVFIHLSDGKTNRLCDASTYSSDAYYLSGASSATEDRKACLFTEGHQIYSGTGSLVVTGKAKNGIATDGYLVTRPGVTLVVPSAANNAVKVKCDTGDDLGIVFKGGLLQAATAATAGKAVSTDLNMSVEGGKLILSTTGGGKYNSDENDTSAAAGIKVDGNMVISGGSIYSSSTGNGGKGISVDGTLTITGGYVEASTSGVKYTYSSRLSSSPKVIRADGAIVISGGTVKVTSTGSCDTAEGIESKKSVTINGGEIIANTYDDAINAPDIAVTGGKLYLCAQIADGFDANNTLKISGGVILSTGVYRMEESLDSSRGTTVSGGTIFGLGSRVELERLTATQNVILKGYFTQSKDTVISLCDGDGNVIHSFKMPCATSSAILTVSCPQLAKGSQYKIVSGGTLSGYSENWMNYYKGGSLSGSTTVVSSFTVSDSVTKIDYSGRGGGPGGPGF